MLLNVLFMFLVNYRGSLGYGQDNILSLPGNVGSQDVKDVQVKTQSNPLEKLSVVNTIKASLLMKFKLSHFPIVHFQNAHTY